MRASDYKWVSKVMESKFLGELDIGRKRPVSNYSIINHYHDIPYFQHAGKFIINIKHEIKISLNKSAKVARGPTRLINEGIFELSK